MEFMEEKIGKILKKKAINQRALDLFQHNEVVSFEVDTTTNTDLNLIFAMVKDPSYREVGIAVDKEKWKLINMRCNCPQFETTNAPCEHIGAALYKYANQYLPKVQPAQPLQLQDEMLKDLIDDYRMNTIQHLIAEHKNQKASLKLSLTFVDYQYIALSIKVGIDKFYVVKDVGVFLEMVANKETKKYGKDLELFHHRASFDEVSQPLLDFMQGCMSDHLLFKQNPNNKTVYKANYLYLSNQRIAALFHLLEETKIPYALHGMDDMQLIQHNPDITLQVKKHQDQAYDLQLMNPDIKLIAAGKTMYISEENRLYVCDEAFTYAMHRFLVWFHKQKQVTISTSMMQDFYINVIDQIKGFVKLSGDSLEDFKPTHFSAKVLLDLVKVNTLSAKLIFTYGDVELNAILKNPYDIARNYAAELTIVMILKKYFRYVDEQNGVFILDNSIDLIYDFFRTGFDEVSAYANIYTSDKVKNIKIKEHISMSMGVKIHQDLLQIDIDTNDFPIDELSGILSAYREHKKYFRMKNGSFINLDETGLSELSMFLDNLNVKPKDIDSGKITTSKYRSLSLDQTLTQASNIKVDRDAQFKQIVSDVRNVKDSMFKVPAPLKNTLRNYQKEGYRWMKTMSHYGFGGILADDMGIGKTIQVITLLEDYRIQGGSLCNLVVCPSSLILNWSNELLKFAPNIRVGLVHGSLEERAAVIQHPENYDVMITSYDYLKRDIEVYEGITFHYQIIDEAQYIKNQATKNATTVKQIKAMHRFALTGTPIENSLAEIWSIFDFLMPDYLFSYPYFKKQFEVGIVKYEDEQCLEALRKMVEPFILRRVKKDVLKELPDKIETTLFLELEEEAQKLYQANILSMKQDLLKQQQAGNENKILVLSMLTKLRQLCCDPRLLYENVTEQSIKMKAVMDIVESSRESGKKVLIFSQFTSVFKLLRQEFSKEKISYFTLTGKTSKEERQRMVNEFNTDETNVFMISLKAGGTGLNLTGAEVVIHFDPWWNLSAQNQATDRAYRLGQQNNVQVYKLICKDTIEEKILELQNLKKDLADSIIFENENLIAKMSINDIMDLF
ncbi:MAG: SNF2-related protein [Erysipelotrichaceae bacterium]